MLFIILVAWAQIARAQTPIAIDSVTVAARQVPTIVPVQTLSGVQLQRMAAHSVADAVRYFSGAQIKDFGGIGGLKTIDTRSMGSAHTGVFYDGVAVTNAQNGVVDLGRFSLANVEAVALYNGQKSDIFQSARDFSTSAALYLVSRQPEFEAGKRNNFNVRLSGGSFYTFDIGARWEHKFSDKVQSAVSAEFLSTTGKYRFRVKKNNGQDSTMVRRNGDVIALHTEIDLFGKIKGGEWHFKGYFYGSRRGYPGSVINESYPISLRNEDRQTDLDMFLQGSVSQQFSPVYSYRVQAKYGLGHSHYLMPPKTTNMPMDTRYRLQEAYVSLANLFTATRWLSFDVSIDGSFTALDADGLAIFDDNFSRPRRFTLLSAAAMSAKVRKFGAQASVLHTWVHDMSAKDMPASRDRNVFSPTVVLSYRPFNRVELDFRAFYKQIFRLPTFNDLYYSSLGTPPLRPEFTTQYNIGVSYRKKWPETATLNVSVDGYFNQVRDKIIASPKGGSMLVWQVSNLGYVEIVGVDVALAPEFSFGNWTIALRGVYTYQRARNFSDDLRRRPTDSPGVHRGYGDQIPYIPRHSGSAVFSLVFKDWELNYSFIYTGGRWNADNTPEHYIGPWHTHDVATSYNFRFTRAMLRLTAEVNNLAGRQYQIVGGYPMPGTNFKIIISLTI